MQIHSITHGDIINYPDHICSTVATQGCNESCEYCHNKELIPVDNSSLCNISPVELTRQLINNPHCRTRFVTITGGEPTLQSDLYQVLHELTDKKFQIKLDTNSTHKSIMPFINHLSYVALDVKHYEQPYLNSNMVVLLLKHIPFELRCTMYNKQSVHYLYHTITTIETIYRMFKIRVRKEVPVYIQQETTGVGFTTDEVAKTFDWFKDRNLKYVDIRNR